MDMLTLLLTAAGLSMDAFAVSVCKGLAARTYRISHSVICGIWFGIFQAAMPLIGYCLGVGLSGYIVSVDHWIAFVLLGFLGFGMIRSALSDNDTSDDGSYSFQKMIVLAFATSVDALAVGITLAFLSADPILSSVIIGVITFFMSALGVKIGSVFGKKYKSGAELAGGIILMVMGIKILMEHLIHVN